MARSFSIPITQGGSTPDENTQCDLHHAMIADYKDYVFYHRIVKGMRKRQDSTRDIALRYENQALIDHIVRIRHMQEPTVPHPSSIRPVDEENRSLHRVKSRTDLLSCSMLRSTPPTSEDEWDTSDDESLIFDIEL